MFNVSLAPEAEKFYVQAHRPLAKKLARCFEQLERNPLEHPNVKRLTGPLAGYWRYRVGDYRVIYRIDPNNKKVFVLKIAHRSEAY
jgi:mRNA interferase RelE/StbE